jgi:hypothetical protein
MLKADVNDQQCDPDASIKAEDKIHTLNAVTDLKYRIM